jgi:hypothetical protein
MKTQFNHRHGAVAVKYDWETLSMFGTVNLTTRRQDQSLNESLAVSSLWRWPMDRPQASCQTNAANIHTIDGWIHSVCRRFNLPVRSPQVANGERVHLDEHAVDHNQRTSNKGIPTVDDVKPEQLSYALSGPHILKEVTFERNNLSWIQEGKITGIHKLIPG